MSGSSQFDGLDRTRALREEERELICSLLCGSSYNVSPEKSLSESRVMDMHDGGMGSIRIVQSEPRRFGRALAEAQYRDSDGVLVSIALNADNGGQLFELDFWKVDFSSLKRYPRPSDLVVKR